MKKIILAVMAGLCLAVWGLYIMDVRFSPAKAAPDPVLNFSDVTASSRVTVEEGATHIALFAGDGTLFETQGSGAAGATQFLTADPKAGASNLLPEDFEKDARAARVVDEAGRSHYFYQQTIDGIPVYAAQLALHQRNNQIYSLTGNIATEREVMRGPLDEAGAKKIALEAAGKETSAALKAESAEEVVFNSMAMGLSDDASNYLSYAVTVESATPEVVYGKKFIVNTTSGDILFTEEVVRRALDRRVYNCNQSLTCTQGRFENQGAAGNADIDLAYDTFGSYYNYFATTFERDAWDNQGAPMIGYIDIGDQTCPNAWMTRGKIYVCRGMVAKDVISHELTHAMDQVTAKFTYAFQSGAIDESMADIFASAIDNNYTMGETSQLGIIRSMEDPASRGQPDRLFSPNYWCRAEDYGGVHKNGGILSKAFMLMTKGGSFNGCTITAIGPEKARGLMYKALANYMTPTTNYKDVYNAVLQSCTDIYGSEAANECIQARNSMRATEMDQQPEGSQKGPKCDGAQPVKPDCSIAPGTTGTPSSTPAPGAPTSPPATRPTTAAPTAAPPSAGGDLSLSLTLRLQGVFAKPARSQPVPVEVTLSGGKLSAPQARQGSFQWQSDGTLKGTVAFDAAPGSGYKITVKPALHLRRSICDTAPVEIFEGRYKCTGTTLTLKKGSNTVDARGIMEIAGDLPDETGKRDNLVNSFDIGLVRNSLGKTDSQTTSRADLNYDGVVDQKDLNIISLSATVVAE